MMVQKSGINSPVEVGRKYPHYLRRVLYLLSGGFLAGVLNRLHRAKMAKLLELLSSPAGATKSDPETSDSLRDADSFAKGWSVWY